MSVFETVWIYVILCHVFSILCLLYTFFVLENRLFFNIVISSIIYISINEYKEIYISDNTVKKR